MRTVRKSHRRSFFKEYSLLMASEHPTANMESVDGTTPSTVSHTARNRSQAQRVPLQAITHSCQRSTRSCRRSTRSCRLPTRSCRLSMCSCVGKRCIVSALTRCVANMRLSSVGSHAVMFYAFMQAASSLRPPGTFTTHYTDANRRETLPKQHYITCLAQCVPAFWFCLNSIIVLPYISWIAPARQQWSTFC